MRPESRFLLLFVMLLWLPVGDSHAQPVSPATIRFSHALHIGEMVEAECVVCHAPAEESKSSSDRLLPTMEACEECHDVEDEEECTLCHLDLDNAGEIEVPAREIVFAHQSHLKHEEVECGTCHAGVEKAEEPGGDHIPEMAVCTTCHTGARAADACEACHTDLDHLRPESHAHDWVREHGRRVRTGDAGCVPCHSQPACQECHEEAQLSVTLPALGTRAPFAPQSRGDAGLILKRNHDLNYRFTHPLDAKGKERVCATCHESATFCAECHRSDEESGYFKPAWHGGPEWGAIAGAVGSGGGRHAELARRDMERCAACHDVQGDDPICMLCHMDRTPGRGNDPKTHSSRFRSQVGAGDFHDDPNSICFNCHPSGFPTGGIGKRAAGGPGFCGYCHGSK